MKVITISAGVGQVFLVSTGSKFFLVDSGTRGFEKKIVKAVTSRGLIPKEALFIFLTHTHYDHAGCAAYLKKMTGADIIVHLSEKEQLIQGYHRVPDGTNPVFSTISYLGKRISKSYNTFQQVEPDILVGDEMDLSIFGLQGKIIHTPGHTSGSSSLIIENIAFVGDTFFNILHNIYPPFANDEPALLKSWQKLLELPVDMYYPAHGKRLRKQEIEKEYQKRRNKIYKT